MVSTMVSVVFDMFNVFCSDDFGWSITSLCVMGACISLFRVLRRGAGG